MKNFYKRHVNLKQCDDRLHVTRNSYSVQSKLRQVIHITLVHGNPINKSLLSQMLLPKFQYLLGEPSSGPVFQRYIAKCLFFFNSEFKNPIFAEVEKVSYPPYILLSPASLNMVTAVVEHAFIFPFCFVCHSSCPGFRLAFPCASIQNFHQFHAVLSQAGCGKSPLENRLQKNWSMWLKLLVHCPQTQTQETCCLWHESLLGSNERK